MQQQQSVPQGVPIDIDALFAAIGELYFQQRTYQRVIAQLQQQQREHQAVNGIVEAVSDPR